MIASLTPLLSVPPCSLNKPILQLHLEVHPKMHSAHPTIQSM
uniref:Uncharacterized protein n=1 Tax=Rhizophora mucronata TaxID=61149 RepID=A0A2P2NR64_RHIMU